MGGGWWKFPDADTRRSSAGVGRSEEGNIAKNKDENTYQELLFLMKKILFYF